MDSKNGKQGVYYETSNGDVVCWVADGCIHLKAIASGVDPVELNYEEVKDFCDTLMQLAKQIE
jgi:hypothetical protein